MKACVVCIALIAVLPVFVDSTRAEDTVKQIDLDAQTGDKALDELLAKEKQGRRACKIDICSILRGKKTEGPDITCQMVQTWPKQRLDEILAPARVSWPWSHIHCRTGVVLKRGILIAAMIQPKYQAIFGSQTMICDIERGEGAGSIAFKASLSPKVSFERGKATTIQVQWGDVEAPSLAKGVIWSITALDNATGVISAQFLGLVNDFIGKKCDEVKDDLRLN